MIVEEMSMPNSLTILYCYMINVQGREFRLFTRSEAVLLEELGGDVRGQKEWDAFCAIAEGLEYRRYVAERKLAIRNRNLNRKWGYED